jgi:hypothetical protein
MSQTSANHPLDLRDREHTDDILTDAANVAAIALKEQSDGKVFLDLDVMVERIGDEYLIGIPHTVVRIPVPKFQDYPDQIAKQALEEVGLKLLAASRATEIVWRDMRAIAKS